jgi:hypothetical protein
MEFKHVLITRLNVNYKQKMPQHGYDPEEWLIGRMKIFKDFCFPSVVNQTTMEFDWIFYIDDETPEEIKNELGFIFQPYSNFHLVSHAFENFAIHPYLNEDIRNLCNEVPEYLLTTRLDTDDMLNKDFIHQVQTQFERSEYLPINFNHGNVYNIFSGVTAKVNHQCNPFMSLVSKINGEAPLNTIFHRMHHEFQNDATVKRINTKEPLWCMTINEFNYSTGFFGRVILFRNKKFSVFFSLLNPVEPVKKEIIKELKRYFLRKIKKIKILPF